MNGSMNLSVCKDPAAVSFSLYILAIGGWRKEESRLMTEFYLGIAFSGSNLHMYNGYNLSSDAGSPLSHTCTQRRRRRYKKDIKIGS